MLIANQRCLVASVSKPTGGHDAHGNEHHILGQKWLLVTYVVNPTSTRVKTQDHAARTIRL